MTTEDLDQITLSIGVQSRRQLMELVKTFQYWASSRCTIGTQSWSLVYQGRSDTYYPIIRICCLPTDKFSPLQRKSLIRYLDYLFTGLTWKLSPSDYDWEIYLSGHAVAYPPVFGFGATRRTGERIQVPVQALSDVHLRGMATVYTLLSLCDSHDLQNPFQPKESP